MVKSSETYIASERLCGTRMDLHGRKRTVLAEAVNIRIGVLKRGDRTYAQMTEVEIVPAADKRAPFRPFGATGG